MNDENKISYEPEADVLSVEINRDATIDFAKEVGNMVVHFTKHNVPVLVEVLNASQFATEVERLVHGAKGTDTKPAPA